MIDMTATIIPKSDQLNADDLIAGPRTIRITRVTASPDSPEQPVSIYFEGDNGKPYRPCKSMRRVMVAAWGADASAYVGRSMTLYRDPAVAFGGMQVGGIRISHMTHIDADLTMALTVTKAKRAGYRVKRMEAPQPAAAQPIGMSHDQARNAARMAALNGTAAFREWFTSDAGKAARATGALTDQVIGHLREICAEADERIALGIEAQILAEVAARDAALEGGAA